MTEFSIPSDKDRLGIAIATIIFALIFRNMLINLAPAYWLHKENPRLRVK
jgi:hypothetical protein